MGSAIQVAIFGIKIIGNIRVYLNIVIADECLINVAIF